MSPIFAVDVNQKTVKQPGHSMSQHSLELLFDWHRFFRTYGFVNEYLLAATTFHCDQLPTSSHFTISIQGVPEFFLTKLRFFILSNQIYCSVYCNIFSINFTKIRVYFFFKLQSRRRRRTWKRSRRRVYIYIYIYTYQNDVCFVFRMCWTRWCTEGDDTALRSWVRDVSSFQRCGTVTSGLTNHGERKSPMADPRTPR